MQNNYDSSSFKDRMNNNLSIKKKISYKSFVSYKKILFHIGIWLSFLDAMVTLVQIRTVYKSTIILDIKCYILNMVHGNDNSKLYRINDTYVISFAKQYNSVL